MKEIIIKHTNNQLDGFGACDIQQMTIKLLDRNIYGKDELLATETEKVLNSILDDLIYDAYKWTIMQYYQRPAEANYNEAELKYYDDLYAIIEAIKEEIK